MYNFNGREYPCCSSLTMGIIGGKWKTAILYNLMNEDGIIKRKVYYSKPPLKVEYSLTDFGKTLIPLIQLIADWGAFVNERNSK